MLVGVDRVGEMLDAGREYLGIGSQAICCSSGFTATCRDNDSFQV